MHIKLGSSVYSSEDKHVGTVSHIVVNPETMEITHLVIARGLLFSNDRVTPASSIYSADEQSVILRQASGDLEQLPEFERIQRVPIEPETQSRETVSEQIVFPATGSMPMATGPRYIIETLQNIPEGLVALKEGARVISSDNRHVGNVEQLFTAPGEDWVTQLVMSKGLLFKTRKVISTHLISYLTENEVHLTVEAQFIDSVPDYEPEMQQEVPI